MADPQAVVSRFYDEVLNGKRLDVFAELAAPGFVEHGDPPIDGIDGFRSFLETLAHGLPDVQVTVEDWITSGDRVVARCRISGTHRGELFGHPATGRSIGWTAIHIWRVKDGRLAERWAEADVLGVIRQLERQPPEAS